MVLFHQCVWCVERQVTDIGRSLCEDDGVQVRCMQTFSTSLPSMKGMSSPEYNVSIRIIWPLLVQSTKVNDLTLWLQWCPRTVFGVHLLNCSITLSILMDILIQGKYCIRAHEFLNVKLTNVVQIKLLGIIMWRHLLLQN